MIIEEKVLVAMSKLGKADRAESGLYVEGFEGGINLYAFNGFSLFRKTLFGDNTRKFQQNFPEWAVTKASKRLGIKASPGHVTEEVFTDDQEIVNSTHPVSFMIEKFRVMLDQIDTPTEAFARIKGKDFIKAINTVTVIRRGEPRMSAVLSFHNGFLDVGCWSGPHGYAPGEEFGVWEEVAPAVQIEGAAHLEKNALLAMRTNGEVIIDLVSQLGIPIFRFHNEEMQGVIMPMPMDDDERAIFQSVMGYEYQPPKATGIIEAAPAVEVEDPKEKKARAKKPAVNKSPKVEAAPVEVPAPVITKPVLVPGAKEVTITIYGDTEGWWVRFPKKIIEKYNLWGSITEASWESKILIFCPEGMETERMLDVIRNDGYVVNIVRPPRETKKSSICFLPHYQGAINYQKAG
ncbi:hypothetical protein AGMMS49944_03970 [Spirochaetia bacterium]|nr:hypothetical protein AGMMS49944_03970 [Spirochaetia bacterium]